MKLKTPLCIAFILFTAFGLHSQTYDTDYTDDVTSIDAIIDAYYSVISGAADEPWQFERDQYIHAVNASITRLDDIGTAYVHSLEAEYIPLLLVPKEDFYEHELKRKTQHYGNMAQVWSAYEERYDPKVASNTRGLNSIQLHFENGRWFIDSWTTQMETETDQFVTQFLESQ